MKQAWSDYLAFLKCLTPGKIANLIGVFTSFYWSRLVKKPVMWGLPVSLSYEPTTHCNLRCPQCPSGLRTFTRPTGMAHYQKFIRVIDQVFPQLTYLLLYFQGEPYLNPDFFRMVAYARQKKIYVATSTNGHYLKDEDAQKTVTSGLNRLIISIDGITQSNYQKYRVGGNLEKVLNGIQRIVYWKKKLRKNHPYLVIQFIVMKHNEAEVPLVKKWFNHSGADKLLFKTAQIYDYHNGSDLLPRQEKYARYQRSGNNKYMIKSNLFNHCWRMWHSCVFTWDGKVIPCCFDKDAKYQLGEISKQDFKSIWYSQAYNIFRQQLLNSRKEIDICQNCTEGTKVWI
ncbi:MAG: radical SAM/SPASM domain-containing protein [Candidatus Cyclobacteriaceae bacterium M3_2C_046]